MNKVLFIQCIFLLCFIEEVWDILENRRPEYDCKILIACYIGFNMFAVYVLLLRRAIFAIELHRFIVMFRLSTSIIIFQAKLHNSSSKRNFFTFHCYWIQKDLFYFYLTPT